MLEIGIDRDEGSELNGQYIAEDRAFPLNTMGLRDSPGKGRKTASQTGAPEAQTAVISRVHHSDTSPCTEDSKERRREREKGTSSIAANSSRGEKTVKPSILGCLVKTHRRVKNLMGKTQT
jgi:hypothetical protein